MLIHFKTTVAGRELSESFLWPRDDQDLAQMKFFAANLLVDTFGRQFGALDPREVECKYYQSMLYFYALVSHLTPSFY